MMRVPNDITLSDLVFLMKEYNSHLESREGAHFFVPKETEESPHEKEVRYNGLL